MAFASVTEREIPGREKTLELLRKRVEGFKKGNKQNVAIIGREYTGKSSLLLDFYYETMGSKGVIPVYLELRREPFQFLERRFLDSVLEHFRAEMGDGFEELFPREHPGLYEEITKLSKSSRKSQEQTLFSLLGLLQSLHAETGLPVLFILDEFQMLSCFRVKNPYSTLGEKIMTQKEVMYLVSSSTIRRAKDILDNDLSLLFGNFEFHEMRAFSSSDAMLFARENLPGLDISPELLGFVLGITGNNPFYVETILAEAQRTACLSGGGAVTPEIVFDSVTGQFHNASAPLHQFFLGAVDGAVDFRSVQDFEMLLAVAGGCKKSSQIAKTVSRGSSQTTRKLEKFVNADILLRFGQVYDYADPLLKLWMKSVYALRCLSFKPVQDKSARGGTRAMLEGMFSEFKFRDGMDMGERLRKLFELFENDCIELAGRSVKLPKFSSVSKKPRGAGEIPVFASAGKRVSWALDYTQGPATEAEITKFLEKLPGFPRTGVKIFLCMDGIETDAKLFAKEKEIWLWTVRDLNVLCGVYEQPRIVLKEKYDG